MTKLESHLKMCDALNDDYELSVNDARKLIEIIRIQNEALKYYGEFDLNHNISDDANCKPIYLRAQEAQQKIESLLSEEK